ncbi:hypothetical protein [Paenibacillus sp. sgz500958]|uniref:hypothetical protein n=1 Tax=Paenibacillus sp. sgz500958 TaxID=3242475 RepID=UPI0036D43F2F
MSNSFNKTEADFAYERYHKMGGVSELQDIPLDDLRPVGTITSQSISDGSDVSTQTPIESALVSHEPIGSAPVDFDGTPYDGTDPVLAHDKHLAADIGLSTASAGWDEREFTDHSASYEERSEREYREDILGRTAPERDELLDSDAADFASLAGLTDSSINYADEETDADAEDQPLEDIPDADDIEADTPVDPASPPLEIMHGTDLLNGSR